MREPNEEKALQALISAALNVDQSEVGLEEIQKYLNGEVTLSAQDEEALRRKGRKLLITSESETAVCEAQLQETEAFMALHRKQPITGFTAKTEAELKRKREELLEKLQKKKKASD